MVRHPNAPPASQVVVSLESMAGFHSSRREGMKSVPHLLTWETLYSFMFSLQTKLDQAPLDILCVQKTLIDQSHSAFVFLLPSPASLDQMLET